MEKTPKGLRLHIGLFGRRNVGKSSLLNALCGQQVSIVSPEAGTTTDPVDKVMEFLPLGPVVFIDTAGLDDEGDLGTLRVQRTRSAMDRCDLALVVTDGVWGEYERAIESEFSSRGIPWLAVLNKSDETDHRGLVEELRSRKIPVVSVSARDGHLESLREEIISRVPSDYYEDRRILSDLIPAHGHVVLVTPVDKAAPKGRLILPQVQTIRDILDGHGVCTVCQVPQLGEVLRGFQGEPDLVVTDSQAFGEVSKIVPESVPLTGFSILFARAKGDLNTFVAGARVLEELKSGDRVLIAEACTHHPVDEDIGRVKIPGWLRRKAGDGLTVDVKSGADFPEDLRDYRVIIHCGACMWTRRQMLARQYRAMSQGVPMTNYGLAIAALHGILPRALRMFPDALSIWGREGGVAGGSPHGG